MQRKKDKKNEVIAAGQGWLLNALYHFGMSCSECSVSCSVLQIASLHLNTKVHGSALYR